MAVTVKLQLYDQTRTTIGYGDRGYDQVVVVGYVKGLASAANNVKTAVEAAVATAGADATTYGIADLDLADADGFRLTDTTVWVTLRYARTASTEPVVPATSNVREAVDWEWDTDVRIGTYSIGTTVLSAPYNAKGVTSINKFYMETVLASHPGTSIDLLRGKTNAASYSIAHRTFPAQEVRYDGAQINPIHCLAGTGTATITRWHTVHELTRREGGWYKYSFWWNITPSLGGGTTVTVGSTARYGTANFSLIPVHA